MNIVLRENIDRSKGGTSDYYHERKRREGKTRREKTKKKSEEMKERYVRAN